MDLDQVSLTKKTTLFGANPSRTKNPKPIVNQLFSLEKTWKNIHWLFFADKYPTLGMYGIRGKHDPICCWQRTPVPKHQFNKGREQNSGRKAMG